MRCLYFSLLACVVVALSRIFVVSFWKEDLYISVQFCTRVKPPLKWFIFIYFFLLIKKNIDMSSSSTYLGLSYQSIKSETRQCILIVCHFYN